MPLGKSFALGNVSRRRFKTFKVFRVAFVWTEHIISKYAQKVNSFSYYPQFVGNGMLESGQCEEFSAVKSILGLDQNPVWKSCILRTPNNFKLVQGSPQAVL
jgi:hypothetical protein